MTRKLASSKHRVTVGMVPREQFSTTRKCLETLLTRTKEPFDLVVVDGGSPQEVRDYLQQASLDHGFLLLRNETYLTPNQARNLVLPHVRTKHVVFIDNDVLVAENWLTALVDCAERTGAWIVGPLYCEFEPEGKRIHMFGGEVAIRNTGPQANAYHEAHDLAHTPLEQVRHTLEAKRTALIEFHTVLVQMHAFEKVGEFDEGFFSIAEHGDFCMQVTAAGGDIWVEPKSVITYAPPKRLAGSDRHFFLLRWSEAWCAASYRRMSQKYGVPLLSKGVKTGHRWLSTHRRYSMPWLFKAKRALGPVLGSRLERSFAGPLEKLWNRWRYPYSRHSKLPTLSVTASVPPAESYQSDAA